MALWLPLTQVIFCITLLEGVVWGIDSYGALSLAKQLVKQIFLQFITMKSWQNKTLSPLLIFTAETEHNTLHNIKHFFISCLRRSSCMAFFSTFRKCISRSAERTFLYLICNIATLFYMFRISTYLFMLLEHLFI